jgi:hypothetical protein
MAFLLPWLLILAGAPAHAPGPAASPIGRYRLRDGPDVASELVLKADGSFDYGLAAGSLDEAATGRWRRRGGAILLTTRPRPIPPVFSAGAATKNGSSPLIVHVTAPDGHGMAGIDFRVDFDSGPPIRDYTHSDDGWSLDPAEHRRPVAISLAIPIYGLVSPPFPIEIARANERSFILTPHDMGRIDFEDLVLDILPGKLVMHRGEARLDYVRQAR